MTYKVQGINKVFWKIAKGQQELTFEVLNEAINQYTGNFEYEHSHYQIFDLLSRCIGDAIEAGVIKHHMFVDAMKHIWPDPIFTGLIKDDRNIHERCIHALISMIRFTQVQTKEGRRLIDFGQD